MAIKNNRDASRPRSSDFDASQTAYCARGEAGRHAAVNNIIAIVHLYTYWTRRTCAQMMSKRRPAGAGVGL